MANDTFELTSKLMKGVVDRETRARANDVRISRSRLVKSSISPLYARYLGNTVTIAFNGNFMKLPVDGSTFELSQGHYNALMKYLHHVDRQISLGSTNSKFMDSYASGDFKKI